MSIRKVRNEPVHVLQFQYQGNQLLFLEKFLASLKLLFNILFINVVHASNISDMHLVINRRRIHPETISQSHRQLENPYVFKPKSYSTKRNAVQQISQKPVRSSPLKKIKRQIQYSKDQSPQLICKFDQIIHQTKNGAQNYFTNMFFNKIKVQQQKNRHFLTKACEATIEKKLNPMIKNQIMIVSNKNQKIQALIHQGLLLSNTSHAKVSKDQHFLKNVVNPFDYKKRDEFLKNIKFEKDYKSGYAPIEMQQKNVEQIPQQVGYQSTSKTHFIRKKQSTLSLPRSCGVSYIKQSQSFQGPPFQPLPPLIFQCSSRCLDPKLSKDKYDKTFSLFNNVSQKCWIPYIQSTQDQMRDLLLGKKTGQIGWVKGIQNLWPLFTEGNFFLLIYSAHDCISQQDVWKAFGLSPFKIGILAKKSTSGKKAFLKSLNIKEIGAQQQGKQINEQKLSMNQHNTNQKQQIQKHQNTQQHKTSSLQQELAHQLKDCRTVITLSLRLQMYVEQFQWKNSSKQNKDLLNYMITNLKDNLQKNSLQIIKKRLSLSKVQQKTTIINGLAQNIKIANVKCMSQTQKLRKSSFILSQQDLNSFLSQKLDKIDQFQKQICLNTKNIQLDNILKINKTQSNWDKNLKMPLYYISTRDSFAFDLVEKVSYLQRNNGKFYKKIQYYFEPDNLPTNYGRQYKQKFPELDVGVTCYHDFFTNQQLNYFQAKTFGTEIDAFKSKYLQMTVQPSIVGSKIKRTKFFFGYRYMWTRCQLAEPGSYVGAGVRRDVTSPPKWTETIIDQFVKSSIAEKDFINSIAINVYHDGKQGLAQHFDDAVRFKQPIYTLRLFSDARLSFGSQFYGFCNGAFIIPLPRGCICVMEQNSYAANGVKHCVRPCDMTGKSAAVILRQMHHKVVSQATKYDQLIDFPAWVSTLSNSQQAVTFAQQKRRQAQYLIANPGKQEIK